MNVAANLTQPVVSLRRLTIAMRGVCSGLPPANATASAVLREAMQGVLSAAVIIVSTLLGYDMVEEAAR
eukprot:6209079-Pleurochrysis_carterae.AAC.4